jgi:hypothetical protein
MQKPRVMPTGTAVLVLTGKAFKTCLIPIKRSALLMVKAESASRLRIIEKLELGALTLLCSCDI